MTFNIDNTMLSELSSLFDEIWLVNILEEYFTSNTTTYYTILRYNYLIENYGLTLPPGEFKIKKVLFNRKDFREVLINCNDENRFFFHSLENRYSMGYFNNISKYEYSTRIGSIARYLPYGYNLRIRTTIEGDIIINDKFAKISDSFKTLFLLDNEKKYCEIYNPNQHKESYNNNSTCCVVV